MLRNSDGTKLSSETIRAMIDSRLEAATINNPFPSMSDILGSDWGVAFPRPKTQEEYMSQILKCASRIYDDDEGFFL